MRLARIGTGVGSSRGKNHSREFLARGLGSLIEHSERTLTEPRDRPNRRGRLGNLRVGLWHHYCSYASRQSEFSRYAFRGARIPPL